MSSRVEKYHQNKDNTPKSRTKRNEKLYQSIDKGDLSAYNVNSNVSVLDVPGNEVDLNRIKEILEKKYKNPIKRKSIELIKEEETEEVPLETKDYDLSKILERARAEKPVDYRKERLKKLRDTQYDILKELNLEKPEEIEEPSIEEQTLMTMIETITSKEKETKESKTEQMTISAELDLLSDLQGTEDTIVVPPITEEDKVVYEKTRKELLKEQKPLENSFYTGDLKVCPDDFEDFEDLKKEVSSNSNIVKVLIVLFSIIVLIGLLLLFDNMFSWGIFMEGLRWK